MALASSSIHAAAIPGLPRGTMPDPVPAVLLARLAVCQDFQDQGIGSALLIEAFKRAKQASDQIGVCLIIVHAIAGARDFYLRKGFTSTPQDPDTLFVRLSDVEAVLGSSVPLCDRPGENAEDPGSGPTN